jgi:hypothetical protein
MNAEAQVPESLASRPTRSPLFWIGLATIVWCELMLWAYVRGVHSRTLFDTGRFVAANMTPLAWCAYLVMLLGVLTNMDGQSWLARFGNRFLVCWIWSVPCWCYFDWVNFYFMRDPVSRHLAWEYNGLPPEFSDRVLGYLTAFGAVCPGMFLTSEVLSRLGLWRLHTPPVRLPRSVQIGALAVGAVLCALPFVLHDPIANLALWPGLVFLLDPINFWMGRPSIIGDWSRGRWGRTASLGAGGLFCGFLWEFWNYWAISKWHYHLPFLGSWEHVKYFEMPVPGLLGFIAFGIETWVMWQFSLTLLAPLVEGEGHTPADLHLHHHGCF